MKEFTQKGSVTVVYTGDGKGKTSAGLGLMVRALGTGWKVAFVQFVKSWEVGEHQFINDIQSIYGDKLTFYKGGAGFYNAGSMSSNATQQEHQNEARKTYDFAYRLLTSGDYQLVICDEINNAVHDGLLEKADLGNLINDRHKSTSLCLTGRNFPTELIEKVDIATEMIKLKHHYDDGFSANKGIDF